MRNLIAIIITVTTAVSCGFQGKVNHQPTGELKLPEYPTTGESTVYLHEDRSFNYDGGILIWDNGATSDLIQEVSNISEANKKAESEGIEFLITKFGPQALGLANAKSKLKKTNIDAKIDMRDRKFNFLKTQTADLDRNSKAWFADNLADLEVEGLNKELATEKFRVYCEAKIWEMATSPYLMGMKFTSRPTPNAICESLYSGQDSAAVLLSTTSKECKKSSQPKSYFNCLWTEGVLKTTFFKVKYSNQSLKVAMLKSLIKSGEWENIVLHQLHENTSSSMMTTGKLFLSRRVKLKPNRSDFLLLSPSLVRDRQVSNRSGLMKVISLYDVDLAGTPNLGSDKSKWLFEANYESETEPDELRTLRKAISLLGKRDLVKPVVGASDIIYNDARTNTKIEGSDPGERDNANKRWRLGQDLFQSIFGKIDLSLDKEHPKFESMRRKASEEISGRDWVLDQLKPERAKLKSAELDLIPKSLNAVHAKGAVYSLWAQSRVSIEKIGSIYQLSLRLISSSLPMIGCVEIVSGKSVDCPNLEEEFVPADVTFVPESGKFVLKTVISSDPQQGFKTIDEYEKLSTLFNNISQEFLVDRDFTLRIYPVLIGSLPFMTGDVKIEGGDMPTYSGSVTLSGKNEMLKNIRSEYKFDF